MPRYRVTDSDQIKKPLRDLANMALRVSCHKLEIEPPKLRWIEDAEFGEEWFPDHIDGFVSGDGQTIFIHRSCSPYAAANTVVHECRHCWQKRQPKKILRQDWRERDVFISRSILEWPGKTIRYRR